MKSRGGELAFHDRRVPVRQFLEAPDRARIVVIFAPYSDERHLSVHHGVRGEEVDRLVLAPALVVLDVPVELVGAEIDTEEEELFLRRVAELAAFFPIDLNS